MGIIRDEVCADRIGLIAEMGAMEEELAVFGCCYLEKEIIKYRVSSDKTELYRFLLDASDRELFPMPVQELTERRLTAAGENDDRVYEAKRNLVRKLREQYPVEHFTLLQPFIEQEPMNTAWPIMEQLQERIEGNFYEEELQLYEMMLKYCYRKKAVR